MAQLTSEFTVAVSLGSLSANTGLTLTGQSLRDLLVDNHIDLDAALGSSLEHVVQPVTVVAGRWAPQVQLRATRFSAHTLTQGQAKVPTSATNRECRYTPEPL